MIYTLTLNPALDYDIYLDKLQAGKLNLSKEINLRVGGKGINVSIMLKNLGTENLALGFCSGFTGKFIQKKLDELKISNKFIETPGITRINVKINDLEEETEIAGISDSLDEKYLLDIFDIVEKLNEDDILVLSGSIPKGISKGVYKEIAKKTKAKTILDTRGDLILENIYENILIKPNIHELEQMFNEKIEDEKKVVTLARKLLDKGVKNVLVSQGSKGAILVNENIALKANIPKGKLINAIGAGDSTVAGFVHSFVNNFNEEQTLKLAVACGSATAYSYEIGSKEMVDNLLNDIQILEVK